MSDAFHMQALQTQYFDGGNYFWRSLTLNPHNLLAEWKNQILSEDQNELKGREKNEI